jgi:RNA polymerase sigma factor (sigma-70 family)
MKWERIEPWDYIVTNVASEYHNRYTMVELRDIRQDLYKWFVEHPNKLTEWEALGERDAKNLLYRSLRNQALDYCQRWKAKTLGYEVEDNYYYRPEIVEALLPSVLRHEQGVTAKLSLTGPARPSAPNEGFNLQAMMLEIDSAYWKLSKEDRKLLFLRYAESMEYQEIANEFEATTPDAIRMRTSRAIRKLINLMGGLAPFSDGDNSNSVDREPDTEEQNDDSGYEQERDDERGEED